MNMPGFTAETSVYRSPNKYRWSAFSARPFGMAGSVVQPQQSQSRLGRQGCYLNCLQDPDWCPDIFCVENCRCRCFGQPGKTCEYQ